MNDKRYIGVSAYIELKNLKSKAKEKLNARSNYARDIKTNLYL